MSEQKLHRFSRRFSRRFSITQQYGLVGWVALAAIVSVGSALIAVAASSGDIATVSVHRSVTRLENVACTALGDASGAMDQVAFFAEALRETGPCP